MVTIQPFQYEKTTAFKERVQIANKVNEIINLFNELDIESKINEFNQEIIIINGKITEINNALNEVNTAVNTVEGYNTRLTSVENESISLDARLDNIEPVISSNTAKIGVLETKDLENVKLSGNQTIENIKTFSNSPIVPNPPSGDTSTKAVNTNWISQTGDSAPNNLVHKSGNETRILAIKRFQNLQTDGTPVVNYHPPNIIQNETGTDGQVQVNRITVPNKLNEDSDLYFTQILDSSNGHRYLRINLYSANGTRTILTLMDVAPDGSVVYPWSK